MLFVCVDESIAVRQEEGVDDRAQARASARGRRQVEPPTRRRRLRVG